MMQQKTVAIFGGGPAGLATAECLSATGLFRVTVYEAMPTVGRKFMLAGKSGLNITHAEPYERFVTRFGDANAFLRPALDSFCPDDLRAWAERLGTTTFIGTSGRVFPEVMKASPLLRAWRARLEAQGVTILARHKFIDFEHGTALLDTPKGQQQINADAFLLAFGGASWPRLGSDASWVEGLRRQGVDISPFRPANCGFERRWSESFRERFSGEPVKSVTVRSGSGTTQGEFVITRHGVEGSLIYAHSAAMRDEIEAQGQATVFVDLVPGRDVNRLAKDLEKQNAKLSFSNRLRKAVHLSPVKVALLRECVSDVAQRTPSELAALLKALPLAVSQPRPIAEAISSAGGIRLSALDENYMITALPGVFAAGEMLDWEAPTGGYLLTACMATGRAAGRGIERWLNRS